MNEHHLPYLPIGTQVKVQPDPDEDPVMEGVIIVIDEHDANLPYKVAYRDNNESGWFSFEGVTPVTEPEPAGPFDMATDSVVLARRLASGLTRGNETLRDMSAMAAMLATQLEAVPEDKLLVATGACSVCMDTVTFNASVGTWEHESSADHKPPALILGV